MSRSSAYWSVLLAACAGASPDPEAMAREPLPEVRLDAAALRLLQEHTAAGLAALAARRHEVAEEESRLAIDLDPRAARARAVLGVCLLHRAQQVDPPDLGLQNRGDGETLRAVRLQPADPVVARLRAAFLAGCGHLSAAAEAAENGLKALPPGGEGTADTAHADLLAAAASYRYELGEERQARPHLGALLLLRPDDAQAHFRYGNCLLAETEDPSQMAAAAQAFARAAELQPDDRDAWLAVSAAHVRIADQLRNNATGRKAQLDAAVSACDRAAVRFPADGEPWFRKGVALEMLGEAAGAEQAYREALQRDASHLGALLNLASLCATDPARRPETDRLLRRALALGEGSKGRLQAKERERIEAFLAGDAAGKDR